MLSASQRARLEDMVRRVHPDLHIEAATIDAQQTLELVLCRDLVCFRPLRIGVDTVDVPAALAGQESAQQAMQQYLQSVLQRLF
jgi:hypothetical protein